MSYEKECVKEKHRILAVAHDAGGANIIASLIKKYRNDFDWIACVNGPARKVFFKAGIINFSGAPGHFNNNRIEAILKSVIPDLLLTGTGWESDLETDFIKCAKKNKIRTACFLDHWANYRERFGYPGRWRANLPDMVLVGDRWAYKIALKNGFSKDILYQVENPYFEEIIKQTKLIKQAKVKNTSNNKIRILYISESVSQHALRDHDDPNYSGYTEYEVVEDLLEVIDCLKREKKSVELKIRLHPSEKINKYAGLLRDKNYTGIKNFISLSDPAANPLAKDSLWADVVIGSNSMALAVALIIGRKVISYIPGNKKKCVLPQGGIKKVHSVNRLIKGIKSLESHG